MAAIRNAEALAIGTELLLGEVIDTNSAFLCASLAERGVDVYWSQRVGDNPARVRKAIEEALERSDLLVVCGGLGPTEDDLTREAIAEVLGETPAVEPSLERTLRERFAARGRPMPTSNLKQAWLIPSAEALPNPLGTAPGWLVRTLRNGAARHIVALPGPPSELERMWLVEALPRLPLTRAHLHVRTFKTHGLGESDIAERLAELVASANPTVATYARDDGIHVRVAAKADDHEAAAALAATAEASVAELLAGYVWGHDGDELAEVIAVELARRGLTVACLEGPSGGRLAEALSSATSGDHAFRGGVIAWSAQAMGALGLPRLPEHAMAGRESAAYTAEAIRETLAADIGVATLWAAPSDGRQGRATEEAVVAISTGGEPNIQELALPPTTVHRQRVRVTFAALHLLRSQLN